LAALAAALEASILILVGLLASVVGAEESQVTLPHTAISLSASSVLAITVGLVTVRLLVRIALSSREGRTVARYELDQRQRLTNAFLNTTWRVQSSERSSGIQDVLSTSVYQGQLGLRAVLSGLTALFAFVILTGASAFVNPFIAITSLVSGGGLVIVLLPLIKRSQMHAAAISQLLRDFANELSETVQLARELHVFAAHDAFRHRLGEVAARISSHRSRQLLVVALGPNIYETFGTLILLSGLGAVVLGLVGNGSAVIASLLLLVRSIQYGRSVQSIYNGMSDAIPYLRAIDDTVARLNSEQPNQQRISVVRSPRLTFSHVSFAYQPDVVVLEDVSFELAAGEILGVVGPTGCGKSTLVELCLGLRQPTEGRVELGGISVSDAEPKAFAEMVSASLQDSRMAHGSIKDNISFFRDIDSSTVSDVTKLSQLYEDIERLPLGLKTLLGPLGLGLSGGQKQRLSLARALAGQPSLLVLDEPTSALDGHTEAAITTNLASLRGATTMIIVAHRLSTLKWCSKILVLKHGRVEIFGSREEVEATPYFRSAVALAKLE
jgi:ABC-type multidrug transport system fused ATPase/permease subunit